MTGFGYAGLSGYWRYAETFESIVMFKRQIMKTICISLLLLLISVSMLCADEIILEFRVAHNKDKPNTEVVIDKDVGTLYSEKIPFLTLSDISKVNLIVNDSRPPAWIEQAGESAGMTIIQPQIILEVILKESGKTILAQVTSENIKKRVAVFIDGEFIMAPVIIDKIDSDRFLISGNFKEKEAKDIVDRINESLNKKK